MSSVRGTPPKRWKAPAIPSRQASCRALRNARTKSRRENPSTAQTKKTRTKAPAMRTTRWPTSTCICSPGAVSNRTVATWDARWRRRRSSTARCTVRTLAATPKSRSSRATTTAVALGLAVEQPQRLASRGLVEPSGREVLLHLRRCASQIALHRVARHAQLSRDALGSPAQLRESPHLPDHLRRDHRHLHPQRCAAPDLSIHKNLPSSDCAEGGQKYCREGVNSCVALHVRPWRSRVRDRKSTRLNSSH